MDSQKVLLRKGPDSRYTEVGTVLALQGKSMKLQLPDGQTIEHERSRDELTPIAGSYVHLARVAPDVVVSTLEEQPALVYKQLLLESKKGLTARGAKDKLSDMERALVDRSWTAAKSVLDDDPEVTASGDHHPVYKLETDSVREFAALFPSRSRPVPPSAEPQQQQHEPRSSTTPTEEDVVLGGKGGSPAAMERDRKSLEAAPDQGAPTTPPSDDRPLLVQRLASLIDGFDNMATLADLSAHLLVLGEHLRTMSSRTRVALVEGLTPPERRMLALAGGAGKHDLLSKEVADLAPSDYATALGGALTEVARRPRDAKVLKRQLADLLDRAQDAGALEPGLLIRLAGTFSETPLETEGLDSALDLATRHLRSEDPRPDVRTWDLGRLARAARAAPLVRTGGRSSLLAALYSRDPDEARQSRWWEGTRLSELAEAGHGPLATALEDPQVAGQVVVPLVEAHVSGVSSRSGLAWLWSLPAVLARHVSGETLARVLADLATRDQVASQWRDGLSNADRITALESEVASLSVDLDAARADLDVHARRADQLQTDLLRSADLLAEARNVATSDRSAHDRQIKLDLIRAFALMAAQVMQSEAARSDLALVRSVNHACHREGLAPLGAVGDKTAFDPASHDPLGRTIVPGTPAVVVRGGYTWSDEGEDVVLLRPQVDVFQE